DAHRRTPLHWAVRKNHKEIARLLPSREDVDCNTLNHNGQAAISWEAMYRNSGVVKVLLGMEVIMPDLLDRHWITPLACACQIGDKKSVGMFLELNDVNPDSTMPLARAAMNGHEEIVSMLLGTGVVDSERTDVTGHTAIHCARHYTHFGVVKLLERYSSKTRKAPTGCDAR
ncbi:ankyrin repeat-containing domain protein, partial [Tuber brumale]